MAGQQIPAGIELRADGLGDAENDAAGERAPHEPSPPMMTASKPNISRAGPIAGSKLARTASSTPATATMASDSAIARPNTCALFRPMSCATGWSSEVARKARPNAVR